MADGELFIGQGLESGERDGPQSLLLDKANRHGLVTGATGTGKTVTLQILAEGFAAAGIPVFAADAKGDLSGISQPGTASDKLLARAQMMNLNWQAKATPTIFWDIYGEKGCPVRTTISEMGPTLLSRLLELEDAQAGLMDIVFQLADDEKMLLLDLDDLQAMMIETGTKSKEISLKYGNVATATVGAVQRKLLSLRTQGGEHIFGEPALRLEDLMRVGLDGRGYVNVLAADKLMNSPQLYATFLLWLMSELFEISAGSRRSAQAAHGVLLRRSAPVIQRRAQGPDPEDRTGGAPDPLQGRLHLVRHPKPGRRTRNRAGPAGHAHPARPSRLYAK